MNITSKILILVVAGAVVAAAVPAAADSLRTRKYQAGAITSIEPGVFQISLDSTLILGYSQEEGSSSFRAMLFGNAGLRYFPRRNLGVSVRGGGVYRKQGEIRDVGFLGAVWANYFMRLGEGMFLNPGAGLGFLRAQRDIPMDGGIVARSRQLGGVLAGELLLTVYLNRRFSLSAGPQMVLSGGAVTPEEGEGGSFLSFDGGFEVATTYSF